jgi:hypothetical protein
MIRSTCDQTQALVVRQVLARSMKPEKLPLFIAPRALTNTTDTTAMMSAYSTTWAPFSSTVNERIDPKSLFTLTPLKMAGNLAVRAGFPPNGDQVQVLVVRQLVTRLMKLVKPVPFVSPRKAITRAIETTAMMRAYSMTCAPSSSVVKVRTELMSLFMITFQTLKK